MTAVADEDGGAAFDLAGRAVEAGYDLRLLCRELARLVRDLLVLKVDRRASPTPISCPRAIASTADTASTVLARGTCCVPSTC